MNPQSENLRLALERPKFKILTGRTRIKFTEDQIIDIITSYINGESCYKIGKKYGVNSDTIRRRLLINGINTRNLSDSNELQGTVRTCVICGSHFKFKNNDTRRQRTCSDNCLAILKSRNNYRENHPQWRGGSTIYQKIAFNDFKKDRICEICGSKENIVVHHIDKDHYNSSFENLQILCSSCHLRLHMKMRRKNHETSIL